MTRRRRVLIGLALAGGVVAVWRSGFLTRVRQAVLPGVADRACILERAVCICDRGLGIAKQPKSRRPER